MAVGVRTQNLRKVYTSAPPLGAGAGFIARADARGSKPVKTQIAALDGLSLNVNPGEIFGLLGPNGAGKSTTVGVLTTRVRPTSGQAWIGEHEVWKAQAAVKHLIGVVPQRPNLDFSLTAREILTARLDELHVLAKGLLEYETLSAEEIRRIIKGERIVRETSASPATDEARPGRRSSVPPSGRPTGLEPEPQPGG